MKRLLILIISVWGLLSCESGSEYRLNRMEKRIEALEGRLDSAMCILARLYPPADAPSTKKAKKKSTASSYSSSAYSAPKKSSPVSYSGQCMATTKKGTRCKRTSRSGGYCWQHGG